MTSRAGFLSIQEAKRRSSCSVAPMDRQPLTASMVGQLARRPFLQDLRWGSWRQALCPLQMRLRTVRRDAGEAATTNMARQQEIGLLILRYGLAAMFLWFGFSQLFDSVNWVSWVPEWASDLLGIPPAMIVLANGTFEVVTGALLAAGIFVRPVAVLLALHLALITVEIGLTPIGVRDFGLTVATTALALMYRKRTDTRREASYRP